MPPPSVAMWRARALRRPSASMAGLDLPVQPTPHATDRARLLPAASRQEVGDVRTPAPSRRSKTPPTVRQIDMFGTEGTWPRLGAAARPRPPPRVSLSCAQPESTRLIDIDLDRARLPRSRSLATDDACGIARSTGATVLRRCRDRHRDRPCSDAVELVHGTPV
jgi:hypothetical protein